jgi:hypothetical protein
MGNVNFSKPGEGAIGQVAKVVTENQAVPTPVEGVTIDVVNTHVEPAAQVAVAVPDVAPAAAAIPTTSALVPAGPAAVSRHENSPVQFDDENIGFEDVILPRINIVQKVGDLSNIFGGGEVVLNQQVVIHTPADVAKKVVGTPPINITILGFRRRQFTEKVGGGKMGLLANNEQEVVKHGGTLDYNEWQASLKPENGIKPLRYFQRLATAVLLIERPDFMAETDSDHILFPYEFQGRFYALALWGMKGIAYTGAAKVIFTARKLGHLRQGYIKQAYTLTSKLESYGENYAYKPVLGIGARTSPEFEQFIRAEILGSGN